MKRREKSRKIVRGHVSRSDPRPKLSSGEVKQNKKKEDGKK
jgi:hypothetical protein